MVLIPVFCTMSRTFIYSSSGTLSIRAVAAAAAAAKSLQSCPTRCDPMDGSPPGSPAPGTLQARTLEWVAISAGACKYRYTVYETDIYQAAPTSNTEEAEVERFYEDLQ